jgi:hypothetical protein
MIINQSTYLTKLEEKKPLIPTPSQLQTKREYEDKQVLA